MDGSAEGVAPAVSINRDTDGRGQVSVFFKLDAGCTDAAVGQQRALDVRFLPNCRRARVLVAD